MHLDTDITTVTLGEILVIKASIFNFFEDDVLATITLAKNEMIELQEPFGISEYGYKQTRFIPSKEFVKIILPVKFIKVGQALILISAISSVAGDVLEQKITVKVGHFILKIAVTCSCLAIF